MLHQEYLYWQLKSRIMWLNYGDVNTQYFHLQTIQHRNQLRVVTLKDDTGLWLTREPLIQHINQAFSRLFQAMSPHLRPSSRPTVQCCPNSPFFENAQSLTSTPQPNEIYRTLRALPPLKASRPDGYHALFLQSNWPSLGPNIIQVIQEVFKQLTIPPPWGNTNLVLIPKIAHLESIT